MKNKKAEGIILIVCGLACIAAGVFVYLVAHKIYPDTDSLRVRDLNWMLTNFGRTGTAILFSIPGSILIYAGLKRWKRS